jgi:AcrR family transcriptional regulator
MSHSKQAPANSLHQSPAPGRAVLRRTRLIDAAEAVFTRDGLRGASMERIAMEAGVARATAYAYFTDKEDAFLEVSKRLAARLEAVVAQALAQPGPPMARIRAALLAKNEMAFRVANLSPHTADLLAAKDRLAAPVFAAAEARMVNAVLAELTALGAGDGAELAAILFSAAHGIASASPSLAILQSRVTCLVDSMLARCGD